MKPPHLLRARRAEHSAQKVVQREGYQILAKNVRYPCGEIDLIARNQDALVFVEVRFRSRSDFGTAIESVTKAKQQRLIKAANLWLQKNDPSGRWTCRFDVIGFTGIGQNSSMQWIKNAF
jgi:putative endonuclease